MPDSVSASAPAPSAPCVWLKKEESYLRHLQNNCRVFSRKYGRAFAVYTIQQRCFKIPCIIMGSLSGAMSVGSQSLFTGSFQTWVPVIVGGTSLCIAILTSIESFLKVGENVQASWSSYQLFQKIHDDIEHELGIPISDRATSGVVFLRDTYTRYQQVLSTSPPLATSPFHTAKINGFMPPRSYAQTEEDDDGEAPPQLLPPTSSVKSMASASHAPAHAPAPAPAVVVEREDTDEDIDAEFQRYIRSTNALSEKN